MSISQSAYTGKRTKTCAHVGQVAKQVRQEAREFFCRAPPRFWLYVYPIVHLVVLVSAFVMFSRPTVWSVSCLLICHSRCPRAQQFVRRGDVPPCHMESASLNKPYMCLCIFVCSGVYVLVLFLFLFIIGHVRQTESASSLVNFVTHILIFF